MNFDALAYPHKFEINGNFYIGSRETPGNNIRIPYSIEPEIRTGDVLKQRMGSEDLMFKVIDIDFLEGGTFKVGTKHPNMLTLTVENMTAASHQTPFSASLSIGAIHAEQVQVGNHNQQITNITLHEVVQKVAEQGDFQTKNLLRQLLENPTVSSVVGAGTTIALTKLLTG